MGSEGVGHGKQAHASLSKTSAVQRAPFPPVTLRPSKACSKAHIANGETKAGGGGKGARPTSQAGSGRAWGAPACEKVHCSRASSLTGVRVPHGVRCAALQVLGGARLPGAHRMPGAHATPGPRGRKAALCLHRPPSIGSPMNKPTWGGGIS